MNNQGFVMNNNMNMLQMNQMYPMMMNNNISMDEQNTNRLKFLLGDIQQYLYFIMNDVNEIENILNNMKNSGLDKNPNYMMFKNQVNQIMNNFNNLNQNQKISLIFRYSSAKDDDQFKKMTIECDPNEFVKDVIKRFRELINDINTNMKFIFNAKDLNKELTIAEAGLTNNCNIFVIRAKI